MNVLSSDITCVKSGLLGKPHRCIRILIYSIICMCFFSALLEMGTCTCHILLSFSLPFVLKICQWFVGMLLFSFIRGGLIHQNVTFAPSPNVLILVVKLISVSQHCLSCKLIILPSYEQPQVSSASVNLETASAVVLPMPEVMVTENWQQNLGEMLANHLTNCGFKSILQGCIFLSILIFIPSFIVNFHQMVIVSCLHFAPFGE